MPAENIPRVSRQIGQFDIDGRIVVRESQSRHYANISWQHDSARDRILLTTPLGQGIAELTRDATGARLVTSDRKHYAAADWDELSEQIFGIRLPLNDLPDWLAGTAPPAASGWRVVYQEYQSDAVDALPTLIEARRGDVELRIKISEWIDAR